MNLSIVEKTKQALAVLFAMPADDAELASSPDSAKDDTAEQGEEDRKPGIIDRVYEERGFHLDVLIESEQLLRATQIMFDLGFYLESITGVDWIKQEQLEVVYDFSRYDFDLCRVAVRVMIPRADPNLPTITTIYTGANWHERETHDFFGIVFKGHPHLIPLLLPEDADFHPLLKDFTA